MSGAPYAFILAAIIAAAAAILADRPEKRPGHLAPIQLISALGAWALIVVNSVIGGVACASGSVTLAVAPVATIICAAILFIRGAGHEPSARSLPELVDVVIVELRDLLGGARRLGLDEIDAVLTRSGPPISVTMPARGRVIVRVHEALLPWIDRHRRRHAPTIGSLIRFAVLHELGHVLNGDHRTFRFARSVLIAHLWWLVAVPLALVSGNAMKTTFSAIVFVSLLVTVQSAMARQFTAERERLADWRAMQSLSVDDASRLLRRSGITIADDPPPTEIEKLMNDMKAAAPASRASLLGYFARVLWPESDSIHKRAEAMAADRAGAPAHPVRWGGLTGFQCGVLATSVGIGILLVVGPMQNEMQLWTLVIVMAWIGGPAAAYCVLRTDPARMSVSGRNRRRVKVQTSVMFALAFVGGVIVTDRLAYLLRVPVWVSGLVIAVTIIMAAFVNLACSWFAGVIAGDSGGGDLPLVPRDRWVIAMPLLAAMAIVLLPVNVALTHWLGLGAGGWVAIMLCGFGAYVLCTGLARSTRRLFRAIAPVAILGTPAPVYGFRFLWRDYFLDITRTSLVRASVAVLVSQLAVLLFFVVVSALAMRTVVQFADLASTSVVFLLLGFAFFAMILLIPDRISGIPRAVIRLIDRSRLEMFLALLESARHADEDAAERIREALVLRLPSDRPAMSLLLPDRQSLWMLSPLLTYVRLARASGAVAILDRRREEIEAAVRDILADDAVSVAPGGPPSLFYSTLAAAVVDEASLEACFPFERMLDRVGAMLREHLSGEHVNVVADVVAATRLLQAHGRPIPDTAAIRRFVRRSTLMSKPMRNQSLVQLCELVDLLDDEKERERLAPIVRSRMWEILQLNPRKEVLALLDCYLAAIRLGEHGSKLVSAAGATIAEIAVRTADELMAA